jgi:hypothetical protein
MTSSSRERWTVLGLLGVLSVSFLAFAFVFVPRLTNNHFGDIEFTGWCGPIGQRIVNGERPYDDFVLPIPPGSFLVTALIAKIAGRPLLIHELWLNAVIHLAMGWLAYFIARPLTTRHNALLVSLATLVTIVQLNKEIPYDHTALLLVWVSVASGVRALLASDVRARQRLWLATGLCAALSLYFKQSTGIGAVGGWLVALVYLAFVEAVSHEPAEMRARLRDAAFWLAGATAGVLATLAGVLALGSSLSSFVQAVFLDGPDLKGGSLRLLFNLFMYLVGYEAFPASPLFLSVLLVAGARILHRHGSLAIGDEPQRAAELDLKRSIVFALACVATFGIAVGALHSGYRGIDPRVVLWIDRLAVIAMFGFAFACAFFVAHLRRVGPRAGPLDTDPIRVGHALNALFIATLVASLLHNTSAPELRSFYDNNPVIPLVFVALFVGFDRARLQPLKALAVALTLASLFGNKLDRGMRAQTPVGRQGYWAGMRVNERGVEMLRAALHARSLARPHETVLNLPEDVNLVALIGRPRPPLRGAILYVDQYANRLVDDDLATLAAQPPKVIVVHPRQHIVWARVFRTWSGDSGTEKVLRWVLADLLPQRYRLAGSYRTHFLWGPATLDVYVRID